MSVNMKNMLFFLSLLVFLAPNAAGHVALRPCGDVNCDWEVTVSDVNALIDMVISGTPYHALYTYAADLNQDKKINISDINTLIDYILGGESHPMPSFSGSLPVLYIITEGHRDIVSREKEDYLHAMWWLDAAGVDGVESIGSERDPLGMQIKGRGNYTWTAFDKKPFLLKLDEKHPLMGMYSNRHFCLLPHADDEFAYLKNTVGFELSRRIGLEYTPSQAPLEVVLNGQYIGLYFLTEKIRVGRHRVNIEEQLDLETDSSKITGGWLLEIDNHPGDSDGFIYINERPGSSDWQDWIAFSYHSPEVLSNLQKDYIRQFLVNANEAIYNSDKSDDRWEKYLDIHELAKFYIVGEMMDDLEHFYGSVFMSKHSGDSTKLIFGPVWDFGNSFKRWSFYGDRKHNHFIYEQPTPYVSHWIGEIAKYPHFQEAIRDEWLIFRQTEFNGLDIDRYIDDFVESIRAANQADAVRWSGRNLKVQKVAFKLCIHKKIEWLDSQWNCIMPVCGSPQTYQKKP